VERALQMVRLHLARTERHPAVRAAIRRCMHLARGITPENHFLAQAGGSNGLSFHFIGL